MDYVTKLFIVAKKIINHKIIERDKMPTYFLIVALLVFPNGVSQDMNYTAIPFTSKLNCLTYLEMEQEYLETSLNQYLDLRYGDDHGIRVDDYTCKRDDELIWQDQLPGTQLNQSVLLTKK